MNNFKKTDLHFESPYAISMIKNNKSKKLTVLIAGFGYNLDKPLFYYTNKLLEEKDTDILKIDLGYTLNEKFLSLSEDLKEKQFESDIEIIKKYLEKSSYEDYIFIGKSLGTTICYNLLKSKIIYSKTKSVIWFTPGLKAYDISEFLQSAKFKSLLIFGGKDEYAKDLDIEKLKKNKNLRLYSISDGNHSLEVTDCIESISVLHKIIVEVSTFLNKVFI